MKIEKIFHKKIRSIIEHENVLSILLIGAGAKEEKADLNTLRDIDLFVITDEDYEFEREVTDIEGVLFDISYMSFKAFKKGIDNQISFLINSLQTYKFVYNINEDIEELLAKIRYLYKKGPITPKEEMVDYIRFKLYQDYEDILSRKEEMFNVMFLINNLFYNILVSYFTLHGYWIPKDKKLLNNIQKIDSILYNLCIVFIKEEDLSIKLRELNKILNYVLKPYGGVIRFWKRSEFPLL